MSEQKVNKVYIDTETTIKSTDKDIWGKANPFSEHNKVVALGIKHSDGNPYVYYMPEDYGVDIRTYNYISGGLLNLNILQLVDRDSLKDFVTNYVDIAHLVVGHNLPFDILHLLPYRNQVHINTLQKIYTNFDNTYIFDTQLAMYVNSAQTQKFISLEDSRLYFGLSPNKDTRFKTMWDNNIDTYTMDTSMLCEYLTQDILDTEELEKTLVNYIHSNRDSLFKTNLHISNEALLMTILMSYIGIEIDVDRLESYKTKLITDISVEIAHIRSAANTLPHISMPLTETGKNFKMETIEDFSSRTNLSHLFFGTDEKDSGGLRDVGLLDPAQVNAQLSTGSKTIYNMGDDVLKNIVNTKPSSAAWLAKTVIEVREKLKLLNSYVDPILENVCFDSIYHPKLSSVQTATGRLAGFFQTIPNEPLLKECMVAPEGYKYVSLDFKQIEIVCAAILSGDRQLISDLIAGIDIHATLFYQIFKREHTPEERKAFKRVVFAMLYGAMPYTAWVQLEDSSITLSMVKNIFEGFATRYPGIKVYNDYFRSKILSSAIHRGLKSENGFPVKESYVETISGKLLYFKEYDVPAYKRARSGTDVEFSHTQPKNYPMQALAADIIKLFLATLLRKLTSGELTNIFPIMTTHDSVDFYVRHESKELFDERVLQLQKIAESMGTLLNHWYHIDTYKLPFKVDIETGPNWANQTKWEY